MFRQCLICGLGRVTRHRATSWTFAHGYSRSGIVWVSTAGFCPQPFPGSCLALDLAPPAASLDGFSFGLGKRHSHFSETLRTDCSGSKYGICRRLWRKYPRILLGFRAPHACPRLKVCPPAPTIRTRRLFRPQKSAIASGSATRCFLAPSLHLVWCSIVKCSCPPRHLHKGSLFATQVQLSVCAWHTMHSWCRWGLSAWPRIWCRLFIGSLFPWGCQRAWCLYQLPLKATSFPNPLLLCCSTSSTGVMLLNRYVGQLSGRESFFLF